jgi:hypothetical protein
LNAVEFKEPVVVGIVVIVATGDVDMLEALLGVGVKVDLTVGELVAEASGDTVREASVASELDDSNVTESDKEIVLGRSSALPNRPATPI